MKAAIILLALARVASAQPNSCRDLPAVSYARLDAKSKDKASGLESVEHAKAFPKLVVTVSMERAPHLAGRILLECPGVIRVDEVQSLGPRNFESEAQIRVSSFAALVRIAQIPAVTSVTVYDPTLRRIHLPPPQPSRHPDILDL